MSMDDPFYEKDSGPIRAHTVTDVVNALRNSKPSQVIEFPNYKSILTFPFGVTTFKILGAEFLNPNTSKREIKIEFDGKQYSYEHLKLMFAQLSEILTHITRIEKLFFNEDYRPKGNDLFVFPYFEQMSVSVNNKFYVVSELRKLHCAINEVIRFLEPLKD